MKLQLNDKEYEMSIGGALKKGFLFLFTHVEARKDKAGKWIEKRKMRSVWKVYVAIAFSFFILEESIQMVTFSTFPLQDVRDYGRIESRATTIEGMAGAARFLNNAVGWMNPVMWYAYNQFWVASDMYADSLRILVAVNGNILPDTDVVTMSGAGVKATDLMDNNITSTAGDVAQVDIASLSTIVIGPPNWSSAPTNGGAYVIASAADIQEVMSYTGFSKTICAPITAVDPRAAVISAKSPFLFTFTAFPRSAICYEILKQLQGYWVVANGEVGQYNGSPQIIIHSPNQIIGVKSMDPDGQWIPFADWYNTLTTTGGGA